MSNDLKGGDTVFGTAFNTNRYGTVKIDTYIENVIRGVGGLLDPITVLLQTLKTRRPVCDSQS